MSDTVIRVENLSKRYVISHQQQGDIRYNTLRDYISQGVESLSKKLLNPNDKQIYNPAREEFWALKDVSFEIKQGDRVGIIGRNGAGKSTLLKILSRIVEPTGGRIGIQGRVASLLEVGTGFHPELTGRENVFLNGAILGMSRVEIQRKFDEIVAFAEVEKFLDTPVKRYSSGMYVRLAFAVAAYLEPEILIVDEVLAVGDSNFQKKCLGKMEDVASEGRTVIFVSHSMDTVTRLCNTAILLKEGTVQIAGSTGKVISAYLKSDFGTTARRRWDDINKAPGNDIVRLIEVKAHDKDGNLSENFDITKPIGITMVYEVLKDEQVFTQITNLFNESGVNILNTFDLNSDLSKTRRSQGSYSSTMWIPGNFLAEGSVIIGVAIVEPDPFTVYLHELDVIAFNVFDQMNGGSARGKYNQPFAGIVRPIFTWDTFKINQS